MWISRRVITPVPSYGSTQMNVINTKKHLIDEIQKLRLEYENEYRNKENQFSSNHREKRAENDKRI